MSQGNENILTINQNIPIHVWASVVISFDISDLNISIDELRTALDVTDRTIARYISELKDKGIIERKGPDNGGKWKIK